MITQIDHSFHIRQFYAINNHIRKPLSSSSVGIAGLGDLGVETPKTLILIGVLSVIIHDENPTTLSDLTSTGQNHAISTYIYHDEFSREFQGVY
jgi:molybdopterin/thiamine biosynthesis adenylyltransferase